MNARGWGLGAAASAYAALACGSGLVGITLGVGIGLPHLAKAGVTWGSVVGLVCLVAGLVLMVGGARVMVRGSRWWLSVPAIVGLVVVTGITQLTVGQALAATMVPATVPGSVTPAGRGLEYRDVTATTQDGVELSAWYIASTNGAAVVLRHGAGSTRTDTLDHAAVLAEHGYGVLMMDARGHGRSGGRAMDFGWFGDLDVRAGVDLLTAQPDVDPDRIGVLGLSMGGEEAIGAAAADLRVRAVIAEGAGQRVPADKRWLSEQYGLAGTIQQQLDKLTYATADLLTDAEPPIPLREAVGRAAPRPILLITGGAVRDEEHAARWIQAGSPDSVTIWVVPGAGHTAGLRAQPTQWEQRVTQFLGEALRAQRQQ